MPFLSQIAPPDCGRRQRNTTRVSVLGSVIRQGTGINRCSGTVRASDRARGHGRCRLEFASAPPVAPSTQRRRPSALEVLVDNAPRATHPGERRESRRNAAALATIARAESRCLSRADIPSALRKPTASSSCRRESLRRSEASILRHMAKSSCSRRFWQKCEIFLRAGGTCYCSSRGGTGGAIGSI
jgi:hypothetical protein